MIAKIIDGKLISYKILSKIKRKIKFFLNKNLRAPGLAIILVGNDIASKIYVSSKCKACEDIGILANLYKLPNSIKEEELIKLIKYLNNDLNIDGILVQLPLPKIINNINIIKSISPYKDVDSFHPYNIGLLCQRYPQFRPCTPYGIIKILEYYKIKVKGLHAVIVGASNIVGRPMILELLMLGCTVTITHKFTKNLKFHVKNADLLIVAVGKINFIPGEWIKPGAIVIDVGINRNKKGKIVGDIDYKNAINIASYITPVPGGIGPMTVAVLMMNTLKSYEKNILL